MHISSEVEITAQWIDCCFESDRPNRLTNRFHWVQHFWVTQWL